MWNSWSFSLYPTYNPGTQYIISNRCCSLLHNVLKLSQCLTPTKQVFAGEQGMEWCNPLDCAAFVKGSGIYCGLWRVQGFIATHPDNAVASQKCRKPHTSLHKAPQTVGKMKTTIITHFWLVIALLHSPLLPLMGQRPGPLDQGITMSQVANRWLNGLLNSLINETLPYE